MRAGGLLNKAPVQVEPPRRKATRPSSALQAPSFRPCLREGHSNLDLILLVIVRILDQVADKLRVDRRTLLEALEHIHLLILDFDQVNVRRAMMGGGIDGDLSGGA